MNYRKILLIASFIPLSCMGSSVIEWPDVPSGGWDFECSVAHIKAVIESVHKNKDATIQQLKRGIERLKAEHAALQEFIKTMDGKKIFNTDIEKCVKHKDYVYIAIGRYKRWLCIAENEK